MTPLSIFIPKASTSPSLRACEIISIASS
jgi:hypothetical protein